MNGNGFLESFNEALGKINGVIWHNYVLYAVLGVGVLFTLWSVFCQYRALTHGISVIRGKYDDKNDPGAINHFQALSAALSATVGLGNIGGVAVAIALGGPGAIFWMWMIGLAGMALKTTEVTLSMIYRNTDDPDNPHGGPMYVASKGFAKMGLGGVGKIVGGIFVITLLISAITGGNMFQAWNVGEVTNEYANVPRPFIGIVLAVMVGAVILGGIKRIGAVAGRLVPFMCGMYLLAAIYVLVLKAGDIPEMFGLIFEGAFGPLEAEGAFIGGAWGYAFLWGMKRALFSSEAGQGSSPIAHSAAKTDEPVREAVVAGLEPFIDTIVVCTLTSLVILSSGVWNRAPDTVFEQAPAVVQVEGGWTLQTGELGERADRKWRDGDQIKVKVNASANEETANDMHMITGEVQESDDGAFTVTWDSLEGDLKPTLVAEPDGGYGGFANFSGATLTAKAFDAVAPGLGMWLVTIASWLFALSTMISWSYYGEQGVVFLFGDKSVLPYKFIYCLLIFVSCLGFIKTDEELDNLTALGTGVMLWANIPIMLIFGVTAMTAYHSYFRRLKAGEFHPHKAPPITDVIEGSDVE